ncbi:unnamed protein product [Ectocarpus sp. 12 AP-2014]
MLVVTSSPSMGLRVPKRASFARDTGRPAWWTSSTGGAPTTAAASGQIMVSLPQNGRSIALNTRKAGW